VNSSKLISRPLLVAIEVIVPVALVAFWWMASANSSNAYFPPLENIVGRFHALWIFEHFSTDILPSVGNLLLGFVMAAVMGVVFGTIFALITPLRDLFYPLVNFYRAIPIVAVIPLFVALLGFGNEVRLLTIVLAAMPPTLIATLDGLRAIDPQVKEVSLVYRFTQAERLTRIYLPAAAPQIFSGLQVSLQFSFIVMIASEMLGASQGIGAMTLLAQQTFSSADMWAGVLLLGIIGFLANLALGAVRNRVLAWYDGAKQSALSY
jgi:ABC-type nitrate/sulfonate/bicarbonate transport system permease component